MEGPSIHLAAEQLRPFVGRRILAVTGNSRIGIERLAHRPVREIFAWGKHLVFQFDRFALRIHFMLWGTFAATINNRSVTGDYRRNGPPRLVMNFAHGEITLWSASLRLMETPRARDEYDFSADILSDTWNPAAAFRKARAFPRDEISDVLLDQSIFAGVGNIIKNEVLFRTRTSPFAKVRSLSDRKLKAIVRDARVFSLRFLELRKAFALRKNLDIYSRSTCPTCGHKVYRRIHGERRRRTYFCARCQHVPRSRLPATSSATARAVPQARRAIAASRP